MPNKKPARKIKVYSEEGDKNLITLIFVALAFLSYALGALMNVNSFEWKILGIAGLIFLIGALMNHFSYKK